MPVPLSLMPTTALPLGARPRTPAFPFAVVEPISASSVALLNAVIYVLHLIVVEWIRYSFRLNRHRADGRGICNRIGCSSFVGRAKRRLCRNWGRCVQIHLTF